MGLLFFIFIIHVFANEQSFYFHINKQSIRIILTANFGIKNTLALTIIV